MAVLATGSGLAKIIGVLSIPIITRIYLPEHIGILAIFMALSALLVPFGTLRYSVTLPLPKSDALAVNLARACIISLLLVTGLSVLLLGFFATDIFSVLSAEPLIPYWWLLPLSIFGAGLYEILSSWAIRKKEFKTLAISNVWQSISGAVTKIGLGLLGLKPLGLLIGQLISEASSIVALSNVLYKDMVRNKSRLNTTRMIFLLRYYRDYPIYRMPSQFLLIFSMQAPLLFSAWQFGSDITGQLALALMALALPITLFGNTMGQAYYAEISKIGRKQPQKIYQITKDITKKLFLISLLPFLVLLLLGPWIFEIVFGAQWTQAGVLASILSVYLLTQFISSPLINALSVFNQQRLFFFINVRRTFIVILVFGASVVFDLTISLTLLMFSLSLSVHYLLIVITVFRVINGKT